jgi:four helix bundle protein
MEDEERRREKGVGRTDMGGPVEKFEDLNVWKEGMDVARKVYRLLQHCKDFGLRDQMQRAAVSVPSNIAEGFERRSNKEFIQHLYIAKGSCAELRTQVLLSVDVGLVNRKSGEELVEQIRKVAGMLYRLIVTRREKFGH